MLLVFVIDDLNNVHLHTFANLCKKKKICMCQDNSFEKIEVIITNTDNRSSWPTEL